MQLADLQESADTQLRNAVLLYICIRKNYVWGLILLTRQIECDPKIKYVLSLHICNKHINGQNTQLSTTAALDGYN
jgi:hypothetical protein